MLNDDYVCNLEKSMQHNQSPHSHMQSISKFYYVSFNCAMSSMCSATLLAMACNNKAQFSNISKMRNCYIDIFIDRSYLGQCNKQQLTALTITVQSTSNQYKQISIHYFIFIENGEKKPRKFSAIALDVRLNGDVQV